MLLPSVSLQPQRHARGSLLHVCEVSGSGRTPGLREAQLLSVPDLAPWHHSAVAAPPGAELAGNKTVARPRVTRVSPKSGSVLLLPVAKGRGPGKKARAG